MPQTCLSSAKSHPAHVWRNASAGGPARPTTSPTRHSPDPANIATRLRQDCRPVPSGRRESPGRVYTQPEFESRATVDPDLPATDGAPRGVVRETTQIEAVDDRQTREASIP